jgi:membrane associated rhomboid family serine protease
VRGIVAPVSSLLVTIGLITNLNYASEHSAAHIIKSGAIFACVYALLVGVPYWLVWRSFKKELLNFVSTQDEVVISSRRPTRQQTLPIIAIIATALMILAGLFLLVRTK